MPVNAPAKAPKRSWNAGAAGVSKPKGIDPWMWLLFGLAAIAESVLRLLAKRGPRASSLTA